MSFIHEALKKAQKEKDTLYRKYRGIIETSGNRRTRRTPRWLAPTAIVLLFLALTLVSWFKYHNSFATDDAGRSENQPAVKEKMSLSPGETVKKPPAQPSSEEVENLYREALRSQQQNNLMRAEILYGKILAIRPDSVTALNNLGVIYMHRSLFEKAEHAFTRAAELKADYVDPYYNLACLYSKTGALDKSLDYLAAAIAVDGAAVTWALSDNDLENVRSSARFREIIDRRAEVPR